jgi:hypothetical protein
LSTALGNSSARSLARIDWQAPIDWYRGDRP